MCTCVSLSSTALLTADIGCKAAICPAVDAIIVTAAVAAIIAVAAAVGVAAAIDAAATAAAAFGVVAAVAVHCWPGKADAICVMLGCQGQLAACVHSYLLYPLHSLLPCGALHSNTCSV